MFTQNILDSPKLLSNTKNRKIIIQAITIFFLLIIIPAIGFHFMGSEPIPFPEDQTIKIQDITNKNITENHGKNENETIPLKSLKNCNTTSSNVTSDDLIDFSTQNFTDSNENYTESSIINSSNNDIDTSETTSGSNDSNPSSDTGETNSDDTQNTDPPHNDDQGNNSQDCLMALPSYSVIARVSYNYSKAYFITDIQGIYDPFDINNGSYLGWCIDYDHNVNTSQKNVTLYSSYCPPENYQIPMENWSAVNYILNHKPRNVSYWDIQTAIWYYVNIGSSSPDPTDKALGIINNVTIDNGTSFIPGFNDVIAVIIEPMNNSNEDQLMIIEIIIPGIPEILLLKSVNIFSAQIGDIIQYTYIVENIGATTIDSLELYDDMIGNISLNTTLLQENEWAIGYANYTINETDLPGPIINMAIVTGKASNGMNISDNDTATVTILYNPMISIQKSADKQTAIVGDLITYSYNISNSGDVTLYNISVTDDQLGNIFTPSSVLLPDEWMIGTSVYLVNETDLPGPMINIVIVNGSDILENQVQDTDSYTVLLNYNASINITKFANVTSARVGDSVMYTYQIENTGNTLLNNLFVVDNKLGEISFNSSIILPGEKLIKNMSYIINCLDAIENFLNNTVNVSASTINNDIVYDEAIESIDIYYSPNITIQKTVFDPYDLIWKDFLTVIEDTSVLFNITIQNSGVEQLTNIIVNDTFPDQMVYTGITSIEPLNSSIHHVSWYISKLEVNETMTVTYELKMILPGVYKNNASVNVDTCRQPLQAFDQLEITVLPCPSEVWVKYNWINQSNVDVYNPSLEFHYNAFSSVQQAIDVVCECGTVYVLTGLYNQQLFINKNLSMIGENTETTYIHPGSNPISIWIPEQSQQITPVVMAYGGTKSQTNRIQGDGNISFSIDGFSIIGGNPTQSTAISLRNVRSGCIPNKVVNTSIDSFYSGIELWNSSSVLVDRNRVRDSFSALIIDSGSDMIEVMHNWFLDNSIGVFIKNNSFTHPSSFDIHYNYIDTFCSSDIGLWNEIEDFIVNATDNWWGKADGPTSPANNPVYDAFTGRHAESVDGEIVIGTLRFDPWAGMGSVAKFSTMNVSVGEQIVFNASLSWGYTGQIGSNDWDSSNLNFVLQRIPLSIWDYKWDYGDGNQGYQQITTHIYDSPGTYTVMLRIRSGDISLDRCDGHRPDEDGFIYGYSYYVINVV
jgi:hypothetical protein